MSSEQMISTSADNRQSSIKPGWVRTTTPITPSTEDLTAARIEWEQIRTSLRCWRTLANAAAAALRGLTSEDGWPDTRLRRALALVDVAGTDDSATPVERPIPAAPAETPGIVGNPPAPIGATPAVAAELAVLHRWFEVRLLGANTSFEDAAGQIEITARALLDLGRRDLAADLLQCRVIHWSLYPKTWEPDFVVRTLRLDLDCIARTAAYAGVELSARDGS